MSFLQVMANTSLPPAQGTQAFDRKSGRAY